MSPALVAGLCVAVACLLWWRPVRGAVGGRGGPGGSDGPGRRTGAGTIVGNSDAGDLGSGGRGAGARVGGPVGRVREAWRRRTARRRAGTGVEVGALVGEAAALLRAGALPHAAWEEAGARRPETARAMARGTDPSVRTATAGVRAAVRLADEVGAPPAEVLDHCVGALMEAAAADDARTRALAGPRATARLLSLLPLLGLGIGAGIGANPIAVFTDGGLGTVCLVVGLALLLAGRRWVRAELGRARRAT